MSSENNNITDITEAGERETSSLFFCDENVQSFTVLSEMDGHRVDYALSRAMGISRGFSQKLIKEGAVKLLPERRIKPSIKVAEGDIMNVNVPPLETLDLEPEDIKFEVVYEDCDIVVINKPAGLVVHPAPGHWTGTLVHGLLFKYPDLGSLNGVKRPGIVHRLDATTSGLMVIARNGLAQEGLFRDFKARRVEKEYIALAYGTLPSNECEIRYPIGRDPYNRMRMAVTDDGRDSWTDISRIWSKNGYSLVRCRLHTGRTHQIRVHMQAIRCPLVGDRLYAPSRVSPFGEGRLFLHSWRLSFAHPRSGEKLSFLSHLPQELTLFLGDVLSKNQNPL